MDRILSSMNYKRDGDILEVKLSDANYNPYYKKKVRITDKKQMRELIKELREKGVNFPSEWEDWFK